jgi:AcrR family transcriptional regulator
VQARSTASVEAILEATIQVLLEVGKERLTTTRVALRAGVSVGTLYQYFPNKKVLLETVLLRHLETVTAAVEAVCVAQRGETLERMGTALVEGFLAAKLRRVEVSAALYSVSDDVDGVKIGRQIGARIERVIAQMLKTAADEVKVDPLVMATMVRAMMAGVSKRMLDPGVSRREVEELRRELGVVVRVYLGACER